MKTKRSVCDIDLLIKWEFQLFKQLSLYKDEEDFTTALNSLISHEQFQLISKLMSKESEFNSQEVVDLFKLGDKFLVSGQAKEKIFSLFVKHLSSENDINIPELFCLNLWSEFANHLNFNKAIEIHKCSIKLNGLNVNPERKEETFVVLRNLAKNYNALYMQDIPLCANDLKVIHPNLIELHIENCPFNFEEQLDLSQLTRLTHFICSNCFADRHLLFTLESLASNLEYLDISGNLLNPIDHSPFIAWIEKQKSLRHLNISGDNLNPRSAPNILNAFFNLPLLEVLNLSNNYLSLEFLKQLSSFPGTLNWKSLSINNFDKLLINSDLFPVCFSKLKQLEYLDLSGTPDEFTEQNFTSSLLKGISELTNLQKFIFNSSANCDYSSDIKNIFEKNPNLKLYLRKYIIKSFEDWKLSLSTSKCKFDESLENVNIENISKSIYRRIYFYLNSSNDEPSQIESLIYKIREIEGLKIHVIPQYFFRTLKVIKKDIPKPMEFFIVYRSINVLKNVFLCCKNYLRPTFFHFQPPIDSDGQLCDFILETKNSHYWKSIEELELIECNIKIVLEIITEINLPNLKYLRLEKSKSISEDDKLVVPRVKNYSLQYIFIDFVKNATCDKSLGILFECFHKMTEFELHLKCDFPNDFPITVLPKGLRILKIFVDGAINSLDLLDHLITFPLLTELSFCGFYKESPNLDVNKTICIPNLIKLNVHQWIFERITFVLPQLRELVSVYAHYYAFFDKPVLDNLKTCEKLKRFRLAYMNDLNDIIKPNVFFSFPNLNEFCCFEQRDHKSTFIYDFKSDEISESLVYLYVDDGYDTYNDCKNDIAKQLQKKRIPYLSKYDKTIV